MKPRVLFFFDTIATGGAERQTVQLAKDLISRGYTCYLLGYYSKHSPIIVDDEIRPHVHFVDGSYMRKVWEWPRAWSIIAKLNPDVIATVNLSPLPIVILGRLLGRFRSKIVAVFHTTMFKTKVMRETFPLVKFTMKGADRLLYVCNAQREYWEEFGLFAKKSVVIHNGIDISRYSTAAVPMTKEQAKAAVGFAESDYVIGLTAVFRPSKNHPQAVDAVAALRQAGIPAKLLFVGGDGETREAVQAYVAEKGLNDHVVFAINPDDVRPLQRAMDVGLLCSTKGETFSIAALETMAMSVPMIMTRLSGSVEMIEEDRGGRLFEIGNTDELVARLKELYDPTVRAEVSSTARAIVETNFAEGVMVDKYDRLFVEVAAE